MMTMKSTTIALGAFAALIALAPAPGAQASDDAQYGWHTGKLPGSDWVIAGVVREPSFEGEDFEAGSAIRIASRALNTDYCSEQGLAFASAENGVLFDQMNREWQVIGQCQ